MRLALLALCVTSLSPAGAIDWTKDPVAQLQEFKAGGEAVLADAPVPRASIVAVHKGREDAVELGDVAAEALGSAEISGSSLSPLNRPELYLALNNAKEKVGGVFAVCEENRSDGIPDCDRALLEFPQLRYDSQKKQVLLGEEIVATNHWFGGIGLRKSFKLAYRISEMEDKRGFNVIRRRYVRLFLVRTGK